jgi:hypothetical protein
LKKAAIAVLVLTTVSSIMITGCKGSSENNSTDKTQGMAVNDSKNAVNALQKNASKETINETVSTEPAESSNINAYKGDWKLKVAEDEKLYLLSSLEDYFGRTALEIKSIKNNIVKGTISSIQGAPSYRQASVDFEGEVKNNKLTATYKDDNWLYSGKIELSFKRGEIAANITRDKTKETPMWGIPQGKFSFVKPIETKSVALAKKEIDELERLLAPATQDSIGAFNGGELTGAMIVKFAGINLAAGFIKPSDFGDRVKESGSEMVIDKDVVNEIGEKYFGAKVEKPKSSEIVKFKDGTYSVPSLGGIAKIPVIQEMLKDTSSSDTYYAIVDYLSDNPRDGMKLEHERLFELQKSDNRGYVIKSINEIKYPIDFGALKELRKQQ